MSFLAKLFARKSSSASRVRSKRKMKFESLERREQMAANITATWDNIDHVLRVEGTDGVDDITFDNTNGLITMVGRNFQVTNSPNQTSTAVLVFNQIRHIQVDALGGDDWIQMRDYGVNPAYVVPMIATGGSGADKLWGGQAADTLYGGWGNDTFGGGGGNDIIRGGFDNNSPLRSTAAGLDSALGFYATDSFKENQVGLGEKWFKDKQGLNYYIKPDGQVVRSNTNKADGTVIVSLDPTYHREIFTLLNAAEIYAPKDGYAAQANILDTSFKLRALDNIYLNWGGKNEKWLLDQSGRWHFILPNGSVYLQNPAQGGANGSFEAQLTSAYWQDLSKLVDAQDFYSTVGGNDDDTVNGDAGDDTIYGFEGNDKLEGGAGNDTLYGGDGNDTIWGAASSYSYTDGTNVLYGEKGDDSLYGGNAADIILGGIGLDGLFGGGGRNTLYGEGGADRFLDWSSETNTIADRASEDAVIRFVNSGALTNIAPPIGWPNTQQYNFNAGTWTDKEITAADAAFRNLHVVTNNTKLLKLANGGQYNFTRRGQQTSGDWDFGGQNDGAGNITIGQLRSPTLSLFVMQQTIYHEIGHSWGMTTVNSSYQAFMNLSGWISRSSSPGSTYTASTATGDNWWFLTASTFARPYGMLSPGEDWCTTWETYFMDKYHGTLMGNTRVQAKYDNLAAFVAANRTP